MTALAGDRGGRANPMPGGRLGSARSAALVETADTIAAVQLATGMIPWFEGGHSDPWNHVEATMALAVEGRLAEAERGYDWLARSQLEDGSWHAYYTATGVEDPRRDTNVCAYVATGVWHHYLVTSDAGFLAEMWPVIEGAIGFVLEHQQPGGEVLWNVDESAGPAAYALLTGSSSIFTSLRSAVAIAERLGLERPDWELAAGRLRHAIAHREHSFEPKQRFSMDWYYPVLVGALEGEAARERLDERWTELVIDGRGVRCVSDQPWVTTAETAECAIACLVVGRRAAAERLLGWIEGQRLGDGSYLTGTVYPEGKSFPGGEATTYSSAAVILASHALAGGSAAGRLFLGQTLPPAFDLEADAIDQTP